MQIVAAEPNCVMPAQLNKYQTQETYTDWQQNKFKDSGY